MFAHSHYYAYLRRGAVVVAPPCTLSALLDLGEKRAGFANRQRTKRENAFSCEAGPKQFVESRSMHSKINSFFAAHIHEDCFSPPPSSSTRHPQEGPFPLPPPHSNFVVAVVLFSPILPTTTHSASIRRNFDIFRQGAPYPRRTNTRFRIYAKGRKGRMGPPSHSYACLGHLCILCGRG